MLSIVIIGACIFLSLVIISVFVWALWELYIYDSGNDAHEHDTGKYVRYEDLMTLIDNLRHNHPAESWREHTEGWIDALNMLEEKIDE
jgi:hypothetical protein